MKINVPYDAMGQRISKTVTNKDVTMGDKFVTTHYELTNHLGNVMAVISDEASSTNEPTVVSLSDYYPFGMTELGRSYTRPSDDYRYGYTGHEKENDLAEGVYTTEYRLLDNSYQSGEGGALHQPVTSNY